MLNKDESNQNEKTRNRTGYLLKEKSMKNILKVRMLGGFTLEYKGKELVLDRNNVSKTTQLFQLLLLHTQDGGISKAALIHSSMPCMAEAMSKIKTAASTTQYSGSESSSPQRGFRKAVTSILMVECVPGTRISKLQ